ncbi:tetratricopeptide repeat protein [Pseudoxanthomonas sp. PXM03]|uniref:tetratricopeptide repeat protein n=1 Tax=Pseudoxanthomonas sp. PXM03 TaxID=2769284 RepID=UPI0017850A53|nr:tetratricopeptide repeat protein [Pseudoxanthomonas sp. PXM03]MBD9436696.1 tetratricopeptide repeat protein [Pseudoxanthomonas sp. PXM03]
MPEMIRTLFVALAMAAAIPSAMAASSIPPDHRQDDALTTVMAGEFALQAGQLPDAARWYLDAAGEQDDAGLAERATRIALLAKDDARAAEAIKLWRARSPRTLALRGAEATLALRQGQRRVARRELAGLMKDPDELGWRYALTALASGGKDPELPARLLRDLLDDGAMPDTLQAWLAFTGLAQQMDEPALAERMVGDVVKRFSGEPLVALLQASQLLQADRKQEARAVLDGLLPKASSDAALRLKLAEEYDRLGDPAAASRALGQGPQDTLTYGLRAQLLAKADDTASLGELYEELKQAASGSGQPTQYSPDRRLLLGQMAEFLKRQDEALEWYRSVPAGEQRAEARLRAINTLFELERKEEAFAEARKLQGDASVEDGTRRDAYLMEAELRQKDKQDEGQMEVFARGLAAYPDDLALLYSRGLAWERRDRIDHAEADFRRILVIEPDNVAALNALGYTLADRTTRYQEALELIDRARTAAPEDAAIIDSYGWVLYRLGRNAEALVELRRAFTLQKDPEIAAHVAEVLWVMGQKDEARRYFDEARKLDPDNRSLLRALEKTGA